MLRSMTGYGSADGVIEGVNYAVEVRSVNNRYYKGMVKLPECLSSSEIEVDKRLRERLNRGTVTLTVRMRVPDEMAAGTVNAAALQKYIDQLRPLGVDGNSTLRIDLGTLLQLPGAVTPAPLNDLAERSTRGLLELIDKALEGVLAMRRAEGKALRADLLSYVQAIEANVAVVAERAPEVVKDYQQRLITRVRDLLGNGEAAVDPDVLAREIAVFSERCDIAEELSRLRGHVEEFRKAVDSPEPAGRKLDFLAQELLRETNTIGSKANDSDIARAVVDMKTAIDRIKEQVQNAE